MAGVFSAMACYRITSPAQHADLAQTRLPTTVAAGGRLLDASEDRWRVSDPEGNALVIVSGA